MHRPGINYFKRIRCVTVGTVQILPPLPIENSAGFPRRKPALFRVRMIIVDFLWLSSLANNGTKVVP